MTTPIKINQIWKEVSGDHYLVIIGMHPFPLDDGVLTARPVLKEHGRWNPVGTPQAMCKTRFGGDGCQFELYEDAA